jgi:H+/Cl- antiporter ClcA
MKIILFFLWVFFLEVVAGFFLAFLYWIFSSFAFDEYGFGRSRANESLYYLIILLPPFIFCLIMYSKLRKTGEKFKSFGYLGAGISYIIAGVVYMLVLTNFFLLGN